MLQFMIVIWLLLEVSLASSLGCSDIIYESCKTEDEPEFPGTEEELEFYCKYNSKFFECASSTIPKCDDIDFFAEVVPEFLSLSRHVCKEGRLYRGLVENLTCLKKTFENKEYNCIFKDTKDKNLENFTNILSDEGFGITDLAGDKNSTDTCLSRLIAMSCFYAKIGISCGEKARNVAVEMAQLLDFPFKPCNPGIKDKLPAIVRALEVQA